MNPEIQAQGHLPLLIDFNSSTTGQFVDWYKSNTSTVDEYLRTVGGVLIRGVDIEDIERFDFVINRISARFLNYVDGNSPRTKLSSTIYTSTEYDNQSFITLHNELSYSHAYPARIFFNCVMPAAYGGETPIADSRKILSNMDPDLVRKVRAHGVRYIRNLHGGRGLGPSWQHTFETEDRREVEAFCDKGDMSFEWRADGGLRIFQNRLGIITHPVTAEEVWFNQIDQFHPSHLRPEAYEMLSSLFDDNSEFPMHVTFGNGEPIGDDVVDTIRRTVDQQTKIFSWKKGDLLILDNILVCHGRRPFEGDRKVLVAMS